MLKHQGLTLAVAIGTLLLTVVLYIIIPKGFFPVQDTGAIQGISEAAQSISFSAMAERQQALGRVILADPAVASLSSYIGVDGTNPTLNSGRMLINLKPQHDRKEKAIEIIRRLQPKLAAVSGITLYLQPVQDLTIESSVSRTQYQFSVESANPDDLTLWVGRLVDRLRELPALADVASDLQNEGLQAYLEIDRDSAARLGVTVAAIDNALYNAFGQRLVSTIFTQANQYRVVLEAPPGLQRSLTALDNIYVTSSTGAQVRLMAVATVSERHAALSINHAAQFPAATISFNLAPGYSLGDAVTAIEKAKQRSRPARERPDELPGGGAGIQRLPHQHPVPDHRGGGHDVHRPGRALRKLHPPDHDPFHAAIGGRGRAAGPATRRHRPRHDRHHRHHPPHRHREKERHHDDRFRPRCGARTRARPPRRRFIRPACFVSVPS